MTFPDQLHAIINDPEKEKAVLDLIRDECLREYKIWMRDDQHDRTGIAGQCASSNLLCRFLGLTKEE